MTSPIRIGSGSIILVPDARQFRAQANADLKKVELYKDAIVRPQLETGFKKNAQARIDRVRLTATAHIGSKLEDGFRADARTKAQAALEGIHGTITARLQLDTAAATARMEAWRSRQQRPLRIRVLTVHENGGAVGGGGHSPNLGTSLLSGTIDPADVAKALQKLNREISRGGGAQLPVNPRLNTNGTRQLQHDMDRMANSLRFQPRVAGLDARLPLGGAFGLTMLPEMVTQVASLTAGLQQLAQAALILPGAFAAAGASLATVLVGVSGLKDAYKALDTVQKDSATSSASQMAAQREMRDAVQDEVRARRDLSDAITNEQRKQRDMALQLRGGKLAEAGAILELQESAEKLRTGRFANRLEYDKGVLEYEQNYQNLLEVRNHNADLANDVAKNEKTGVQNSDPVLNASEALTKATERMTDASQKLAQGSSALGTASAKAQEALDKLSPSAQDFIKNLIAMRPEFHRFAQGVQEDLMSGLTPAFNNLFHSPAIQSNMRGGMKALAAQMNAQIKTVMGDLGSPQMGGMFDRIFGSTTDSANRFNQGGLTPLINGIARLGAVGAESLPRVSDALNVVSTRFDNFISKADKDGSLKHWIDQGLDSFTQLGRIVQNIFNAMSGVNRVFGGSFLQNVDTVTKRIADFLNSGRGQSDLEKLVVDTREAMAEWRPILEDLIPIIKTAFDTARTYVSNLLGPIGLLLKAFNAAPGLITGIVTAFATWKTISTVIGPIVSIVGGLQGHLATVSGNLENVGGKMGNVGKSAGELAQKLGTFGSAVAIGGPIVGAITGGIMLALDLWNDKQRETQRETEQLIQKQNEFAESLDRTSGLITQQSRDQAAKSLADYKPTHGASLSGHILADAASLGIKGSDVVTAAMPGGGAQYGNIMGQLRDKVRPAVRNFLSSAHVDLSQEGLSEDDVVNAYLGDPAARAKFDAAKSKALDTRGSHDPFTQINLGQLDNLVSGMGGDTLKAASVGQGMSGVRQQDAGGGDPNSPANLARRAANPDVGLPTNSIFGKGFASAGNGEYKIVTTTPPDKIPGWAKLEKRGAKAAATVPGAVDPSGKPFSGFEYTLPRDLAQRYMTNVPQYHTGGPTKAGLGNLLDDEFVIHDRDRFPKGSLEAINEGKVNPDDLPHFFPGGPVPIDIPPPIPVPPAPVPAAPIAPPVPAAVGDLAAGLGTAGGGEHPMLGGGLNVTNGAPAAPMPPSVPGATSDFAGNPLAPTVPGNAPVPTIPGGGLNSLIFGAQGAPSGGFGSGQGIGGGILQSFLGGGGSGGGQSIGGMMEQIAGKFGQIAMQGLLGFFGINPQYLGDLAKLIPGLSKAFGGGFSDPSAQAGAEGLISGYAADGSPIAYNSPFGTPGTALPDANSTGTGGGGPNPPNTTNPVSAPGGLTVSANPASKASLLSGAPNVEANIAAARGSFSPIYQPGLNTGGYGGATNGIPDWAVQLGNQFGLTPSTYADGGTLHQMGFAFDFTPVKGNTDPTGSMNRFSQFITDNLGSQTLQLIHSDPGANGGRGQNWGIAAGKQAESISPTYYTGDGGYGDHRDHVHWATDVPVLLGNRSGAAATDPNNPLVTTMGGSPAASTPSTPSGGPSWSPPNTNPGGPQVTSGQAGPTPLPDTIASSDNGPLPPATLSPPSSSGDSNLSGPGGSDDATQVLALTKSHGALVVESLGVAKANGDSVLGPAPKDGTTPNWGNVLGNGNGKPGAPGGGKPPPGTDDAGLNINIPDSPLIGGGGGNALPPRLLKLTQGIAATRGSGANLSQQLDATAGVSAGNMSIKSRAKALYLKAGLPEAEWPAFDQLISHESSWNPTAQNPGSTAHGLGQFLDTTWATVGAAKTDDADSQLQAVFRYLKQRPDYHGSPAAAWNLWQQRHWYDQGGVVDDLKGMGGIAGTFLDDAGVMALNAFAQAKGGSSRALGFASKALGPFGMIAPELMDAISPQAHTSSTDTLDYTKLPHHAGGGMVRPAPTLPMNPVASQTPGRQQDNTLQSAKNAYSMYSMVNYGLKATRAAGTVGDLAGGPILGDLTSTPMTGQEPSVNYVPGSPGYNPMAMAHFASGDYVRGGSGRKDDVLAMLMGGEFVQRKKAVQTYGLDFHHAINNLMIPPGAVQALMRGGVPGLAEGGTLGGQPPSPNDLQQIQAQLASSVTPTPPAPPQRSGISVPDVAHMIPPAAQKAPTATQMQPVTAPPPQPGQPTTPPPPAPLEPEAGVPVQPTIAAAPSSTDHELPALKQGITSAAATLGSLAATAAGASGFGAPAAGAIAGLFNVGGKVANSIANVVSSAMVGTLTPGTTANPYGQRVKGFAAPQTLMPSVADNSTHYHGDLYANDMDDFMRRQDIRDSVNLQSQMAAVPGV